MHACIYYSADSRGLCEQYKESDIHRADKVAGVTVALKKEGCVVIYNYIHNAGPTQLVINLTDKGFNSSTTMKILAHFIDYELT